MAMTRDFVFVSASGLHVSVTFDGESQTLLEFYREYDKAFVLPNEKEELAGFQECLALNHGAVHDTLSKRYGEFREPCFVARETPEGPIVGGGNLIALPLEGRVTANLNYLFVSSAFRGKGFFRKVLGAALELTSRLFESPAAPLVFFEQNDPLAMSAEAYARDTEATGIDQVDRLRIWARVGARLVDFDYVQPPLSEMHSADHTLLYAVLGAEGPSIGSCLLAEHLSRFFAISVAKGKELGGVAREQVEALRELCTRGEEIALLEYGMYLSDVVGNNPVDALKVRHKNLRSAVKSAALGSLHWTISLYIDNDRLPARLRAALDPSKAQSVQGMTESASLRDAIEPLFNDVADRERLGFVQDYLIRIAENEPDPGDRQIRFDGDVRWATEGVSYRTSVEPREYPFQLWRFWYVHGNGSLSYHVTIKVDFRHDLTDLYFLSSLQKLVAPKEVARVKSDWTQAELWRDHSADCEQRKHLKRWEPMCNRWRHESHEWQQARATWGASPDVVRHFQEWEDQRSVWERQHKAWRREYDAWEASESDVGKKEWHWERQEWDRELGNWYEEADRWRRVKSDVQRAAPWLRALDFTPPLHAPRWAEFGADASLCNNITIEARSFWAFLCSRFEGDMVSLARKLCGSDIPAYTTDPDGDPLRGDYPIFDALIPQGPFVEVPGLNLPRVRSHFLFKGVPLFYTHLPQAAAIPRGSDRHAYMKSLHIKDYRQHLRNVVSQATTVDLDPQFWNALGVHNDPRTLHAMFAAGFNQNIVDFLNQDVSEVLDGTDPIYPTSEDQASEGLFVRLANPRALVSYLVDSRSLEAGERWIGTCPYAFLIHVLSLHNEFLVREYETTAARLVESLDDHAKRKSFSKAADTFYAFRVNEHKDYLNSRVVNVFRYDTERDVFQELESIRGVERKTQYVDLLIEGANERTRDSEAADSKKEERSLNFLLLIIGLFSAMEVVYQLYEAAKFAEFCWGAGSGFTILWAAVLSAPDRMDSVMRGIAVITALLLLWMIVMILQRVLRRVQRRA